MAEIKRQLFFKDVRIHDINQTNALNAVYRYLGQQKDAFYTTLNTRKGANKTAIESKINETINGWKDTFNGNVSTIKTNLVNYLTSSATGSAAPGNDSQVGANSWGSYTTVVGDATNKLYNYLESGLTDADNVFKQFNDTLGNYASKTVVDALDEFAKVMDSAFIFGEDYPGYVTDITQNVNFVDLSDVSYLSDFSTAEETAEAPITEAAVDIFFSDEANVYYKNDAGSFKRLYKDGVVVREYYKDLTDLAGAVYYNNDNVQFRYKTTESFVTINHNLSWPVPKENVAVTRTGTSNKVYLTGDNKPSVVYYSPSLTNYAVLVGGQYKRIYYNNALEGASNADVELKTTSSQPRKTLMEAISGVFDATGSGSASLYNSSFYFDGDNLTYSFGGVAVKDWSAIYNGKVQYAKETSTVKKQVVDGVTYYYTKVTTNVVSTHPTTFATVYTPTDFVCLLMDDSTYRPIIKPNLTKAEVLGTLAVFYDQHGVMTVSSFETGSLATVN